MSEDPTIVNPTFDTSIGADAIELGAIDDNATVDAVHPFPEPPSTPTSPAEVRAGPSSTDDDTVVADQPPLVVPPDITRISDDPLPPPPENLADPMM